MDNSTDHHSYPNLNSEAYRNLTDRTSVVDKQLQVILINDDDETVFIGASNMTDRYWNGTISIYNSLEIKKQEPISVTKTESGIIDAIHLGRNKYIIGEESGIVQITELKSDEKTKVQELSLVGYACNHDSSVLSLSAFSNKINFVSGGLDYSIKIWDVAELCVSYSFVTAHVNAVSCVATQPNSDYVFSSCSWNGDALLWDIRKPKPAKEMYTAECGLSALDWKPDNENILAIGQDDGAIKMIDIRKPTEILSKTHIFRKRIHRVKYNPNKTNFIAVCADDIIIRILDSEQDCFIVYEDDIHTDFVRSLAWHKHELFSCSWDNTIQKRSLSSF